MAAPCERRVGRGVLLKRHKSAQPAKSRLGTVGRDFMKLCERNKLHLGYIRIMHALGLVRRDAFFNKNFTYLRFFV
jgi:hypothetical protein